MANDDIQKGVYHPPHQLDDLARTQDHNAKPKITTSSSTNNVLQFPPRSPLLHRPTPKRTAYIDIFVDDFIALVQGCPHQLSRVRRSLFHNIDLVFRPLDLKDGTHRRQPISLKKLAKGDCSWDYIKIILGWEI